MNPDRLAGLYVSLHASKRFVERGGEKSMVRAEVALLELAKAAWPITTIPRCAKSRPGATYFRSGDWILVVQKDSLVTVYPADGQWQWTS